MKRLSFLMGGAVLAALVLLNTGCVSSHRANYNSRGYNHHRDYNQRGGYNQHRGRDQRRDGDRRDDYRRFNERDSRR